MLAYNIMWDTEEEAQRQQLPDHVPLQESLTGTEEISDYLTEMYGFCHNGFLLRDDTGISKTVDRYFRNMQKNGMQYRKTMEMNGIPFTPGYFPKAASFAFKFWSIADMYDGSDIIIDEKIPGDMIREVLDTYRAAGLKSMVITGEAISGQALLEQNGCVVGAGCTTQRLLCEKFRKIPKKELIRGTRVYIMPQSG